jgi:hypothetical protein
MEGKWRKSSYSNGGEANCVELDLGEQGLLVRDSKGDLSVMLSFAGAGASAFLSAVKVGRFDR